jgi:hypothetical protein
MPDKKRVLAVDFDKTLAFYEDGDFEKRGPEYAGAPIEEMVSKVKQAIADGAEVFIYTARVNPGDDSFVEALDATKSYLVIAEWCKKNLGQLLPITHEKSRRFSEFWDDRAKEVVPNHGVFITELMEASQ